MPPASRWARRSLLTDRRVSANIGGRGRLLRPAVPLSVPPTSEFFLYARWKMGDGVCFPNFSFLLKLAQDPPHVNVAGFVALFYDGVCSGSGRKTCRRSPRRRPHGRRQPPGAPARAGLPLPPPPQPLPRPPPWWRRTGGPGAPDSLSLPPADLPLGIECNPPPRSPALPLPPLASPGAPPTTRTVRRRTSGRGTPPQRCRPPLPPAAPRHSPGPPFLDDSYHQPGRSRRGPDPLPAHPMLTHSVLG